MQDGENRVGVSRFAPSDARQVHTYLGSWVRTCIRHRYITPHRQHRRRGSAHTHIHMTARLPAPVARLNIVCLDVRKVHIK